MPAGVSWPMYLRHTAAALLTMFAGSQVVHMIYRPLDDMEELVTKEKERIIQEAEEIKKNTKDST